MTGLLRDRKRYIVVALLFLLSAISYLDRQALSVLAPMLRDRFGMTTEEYSYAATSFLVAYALGYLFAGRVLDRFGVKLAIGCALAFWSLAGMLHAFASGWRGLAVFRFFLGLGESFNGPGGGKALSEWAPRRERAFSVSIMSTGHIAGAVIAPPLCIFLAKTWGWQSAFLVTGAIGFAWLAVWWRFYDAPETHRGLSDAERAHILAEREPKRDRMPFSTAGLLRNPACYGLFVTRFLTDPIPYFFTFWLPEYLRHSRGFSMELIAMTAWIPYLAADLGGMGGGAISDWLVRHGWTPQRARLRMMLLAACLTPMALVAVRTETGGVAIACIGIVLAASSCWMGNMLTTMTEIAPRGQVASVMSLAAMGGSIGGIISTLITGRVISRYGYVPIFTVLGFLHLTAFLFLTAVLRRQRERVRE